MSGQNKHQAGFTPRDQVLNSALALFTEQGYFNTSIPDIVRASGVSTGSIYHHFGDKEGIAKALFDSMVALMEQSLDRIESKQASAKARCQSVIELMFRMTEEEPDVMKYMLHAKHKEFLPEQAPICSSRPFQRMREFVAQGMAEGEICQMDPTVAAAALFGGALRMIQLRLDGILEDSLLDFMDDIWTCGWRSVAV